MYSTYSLDGIGSSDLHGIVTPINVERLDHHLTTTNYNERDKLCLLNGFRHGFDIGYRGPQKRKNLSNNIPISVGSEQEMLDKLLKKVKLWRHAGPFTEIPYQYFVQSPIGLVPKAGNQTRLIFHLSFDFRAVMTLIIKASIITPPIIFVQ